MPRPKQCRRVCLSPDCTYFKPAGVPTSTLEEVVVAVDELEAMRLVDLDGLYYEQAAEQMGVSRRTFGRIIDSARRKVAQALIQGMALRIEGGVIEMARQRHPDLAFYQGDMIELAAAVWNLDIPATISRLKRLGFGVPDSADDVAAYQRLHVKDRGRLQKLWDTSFANLDESSALIRLCHHLGMLCEVHQDRRAAGPDDFSVWQLVSDDLDVCLR